MAIFGLREETTLQARLRDCLFPQTSEPDSRFCLLSTKLQPAQRASAGAIGPAPISFISGSNNSTPNPPQAA